MHIGTVLVPEANRYRSSLILSPPWNLTTFQKWVDMRAEIMENVRPVTLLWFSR